MELIQIIVNDQPEISINMNDIVYEKYEKKNDDKIYYHVTKFKKFAKLYNLDKLMKHIQIDDPVYHILYILSTWI